jgi:phosphomannomutase
MTSEAGDTKMTNELDEALVARAKAWIADDAEEATQAELSALLAAGNVAELRDRLSGPLEFGTAGLRGVIGAGENRMNRSVILRTSDGLARYLLETVPDARTRGLVVGYDGRRFSLEFAQDTASVFAAHGIPVVLFQDVDPTPLVAFTVRKTHAAAGVMVTASHNPPEYNGYKVYWGDGAQIIPPHDTGIAAKIAEAGPARAIVRAPESPLITPLDPALIEAYLDSIKKLSKSPNGRDLLRIVYTPLHGVGDKLTRRALAAFGFTEVASVPEQQKPDGTFPTVNFPNPEEKGALDLAFALAAKTDANLVLANDPDADRLAVALPWPVSHQPPGGPTRFRQLSGNEVGVLLGEFLLRHSAGDDRLVVTTIVSSPMLGHMAKVCGVRYGETLTGFKWIAAEAGAREQADGSRFLFGYEEALGYCVGPAVRDKDGVSAAAVFAELTALAAAEGRTLHDELERIARAYGLFVSRQHNITRKGAEGAAAIGTLMDRLRQNPPEQIGGHAVTARRDLKTGVRVDTASGAETRLTLPSSNVLVFEVGPSIRVIARPSGTEPKVKFYFDWREEVGADESFTAAETRANQHIDALVAAFVHDVATPALPPG